MKFFKKFKLLFLLAIILAFPHNLTADPIDPCTAPDLGCPVDSNLIVLVVAAGIIAAKKAYSFKNSVAKV